MAMNKFELIVNNEMVTFTAEQIKEEVKGLILKHGYFKEDEEGFLNTEIYLDYRDELSENQIKAITTYDGDMMERFYEELDEHVTEQTMYEETELFNLIRTNWKDDVFGDYEEYEELIEDYVRENVYFNFPYDRFLKTDIEVNIIVDTGDGNEDFTLNNFSSYNGNGEIEKESSLLWLAKQQGYTKKDLKTATKKEVESKLLNSIVTESANCTSHMNALTFFVSMTLEEYINMMNEKKGLILSTDTSCGLHDNWNGAGSLLEIQLEKNITLTHDMIQPHIDGNRGYGVNEVYGMSGGFWKDTVLSFI